jgi:hypothetical protein
MIAKSLSRKVQSQPACDSPHENEVDIVRRIPKPNAIEKINSMECKMNVFLDYAGLISGFSPDFGNFGPWENYGF